MSLSSAPDAGFWNEVAVRFGLGTPSRAPHYVARGAMGQIWHLEAAAQHYAVKILFEPVPDESKLLDIRVQATALAAGLPLPAPIFTAEGLAVPTIHGRSVRLYRWEQLDPPLPPPVTSAVAREVGRLLGLIHSLDLEVRDPAVWSWYTTPPSPADWESLLARAEARGAPWSGALRHSRSLISELEELIVPFDGSDILICHRDFDPSNVLPRTDGSGLCILGWENVGPLPAGAELGYVLLGWTADGVKVDRDSVASLLAGYRSIRPNATPLEPSWASVFVVTMLNFLMAMGKQALDDENHRPFAEGWVRTMLEGGMVSLKNNIAGLGALLTSS